jgi:adenylate cyclase
VTDARAVETWLAAAPHDDPGGLLEGLAARLAGAGVPVSRASCALMTMHPELVWRTVQWSWGEGVTLRDQPRSRLEDAFYTASPVAVVRRTQQTVRVPLVDDAAPFSICRDLRARGATDYVAMPLPFTNGEIAYASFATSAPGGFTDAQVALLLAIAGSLARRLELESAYFATRALLDVYLGKNAARRVLAGEVQRGRGEQIDAAIWFCDMRGFTALGARRTSGELVAILDAYFDVVGSAIADLGGEVLKFIGDAVLAIFPVGDDPRDACGRAIAAAERAFASLARLNDERAARAEEPIAIGVALHRGPVLYGNIGARDRLDFTVISSAVNTASRLESLCKELAVPLVLSADLVDAAKIEHAVDCGEHVVKGLAAPIRVFTLGRASDFRESARSL